MHEGFHVKCLLQLSIFKENCIVSTDLVNSPKSYFIVIHSVIFKLLYSDMLKQIGIFMQLHAGNILTTTVYT